MIRLVWSKPSSSSLATTSLKAIASSPSSSTTDDSAGKEGTSDKSGAIWSNGKYGMARELDNATDVGGRFLLLISSSEGIRYARSALSVRDCERPSSVLLRLDSAVLLFGW